MLTPNTFYQTRPHLDSRTVFNAILFVLETGTKWMELGIFEKNVKQAIGISRGGLTTKISPRQIVCH